MLCDTCHVPEKLFTVIFWLGYCNSLMNPIIYASSSREFHRAFIKVLQCYWVKRKLTNSQNPMLQCNFRTFKLTENGSQRKSRGSNNISRDTCTDSMFISRRGSESPVKSLLIFQQEKRKTSSQSIHNMSKRSSYSDLESDGINIELENLDSEIKNYSSMVWYINDHCIIAETVIDMYIVFTAGANITLILLLFHMSLSLGMML